MTIKLIILLNNFFLQYVLETQHLVINVVNLKVSLFPNLNKTVS